MSKPWLSEPSRVQWVDIPTGLDCLILRNQFGALCGYVAVPSSHPFFGKHGEEIPITAYGGLTHSGLCDGEHVCHEPEPGRPEHVWWFGFDCGHCGDIAPHMLASCPGATYKDIEFVRREVEILARQLSAYGRAV